MRVLIISPLKNEAFWLPRHLKAWEKVDYPRDQIRWVIQLGRSIDMTEKILRNYFKKHKWNVEIYPDPKHFNPTGSAMFLADVVNEFKKYYKEEDFIVLDDGDTVGLPKAFLKELIKLDLDIVAPSIWIEKRNPPTFFDTYVFRTLDGSRFPPIGIPYKDSKLPIQLGSVGTTVLIKGNIFKEIPFENPIPTLQFCRNARKAGYKVWFAPWVNVYHADIEKERSEYHQPLEWYVRQGRIPKEMLEKVK